MSSLKDEILKAIEHDPMTVSRHMTPGEAARLANKRLRPLLLKLADGVDVLETIRDGFDCDADAHKYGTPCRCCLAKSALTATSEMLNALKGDM
jgi:hypothetical protein